MLKTKLFSFDRKGNLIIAYGLSNSIIIRIIRLCIEHARRKHTKQPCKWALVPTLEHIV